VNMGRRQLWGSKDVQETIGDAITTVMQYTQKLRDEMGNWRERMFVSNLSRTPRYYEVMQVHMALEQVYDQLLLLSLPNLPLWVQQITINFQEYRRPNPSRQQQLSYIIVRLQTLGQVFQRVRNECSVDDVILRNTLSNIITSVSLIVLTLQCVRFPQKYGAFSNHKK
jgi:hypothetical protein